jgi:hypothetical protein
MEDFDVLLRQAQQQHQAEIRGQTDVVAGFRKAMSEQDALAAQTHRDALRVARILQQSPDVSSYLGLPADLHQNISASVQDARMPSRGMGGGDWTSSQVNRHDSKQRRQDERRQEKLEQAAQGSSGMRVWDINSVYHFTSPTDDDTTLAHVHMLGHDGLYLTPLTPHRGMILPVTRFNTYEARSAEELNLIRECLASTAVNAMSAQTPRRYQGRVPIRRSPPSSR